MIMCIGQRYYVLLFLIGLCTAARQRVRTPDVSTSTSNRDVRARQLEFARQPEVVENVWDNIDVQKLDEPSEKIESWRRAGYPNASSSTTVADNRDRLFIENTANGLEERQAYPEVPIGGPIGEVPRPLPTRPTQPPYPPNPPSSPLGCLAPRGQFPSPNSCANYLNCWDDVVIEQQCPLGLLFNDLTNVCDFDYNVNCGSRPGPTPKPSLPSGSKHCPDENGRYRSTTNCSEFYVCLAGQPIKFNCPPGLVYNDEYGVCDYVYNVDCGSAVTPKPTPPPTEPPTRPPPSYPSNPPTRPPTRPPSSYPSNPPTRPPTQPPTSRPPSYPTAPSRPTRPPPTQYPQQPSYPPQQPSYPPPQQPGYPPQQPAYPPQQPAYPPPAYPAPAYPQPSYPQAQTQTTPEINVPEEVGFNNPWNVAHDLPDDIDDDIPCNDNEVKKLDEFCTSVVVCRNRQRALVQCSTGFTYDTPSDSCKPFTIAKC